MKKPTCETCVYLKVYMIDMVEDDVGICRRRSPKFISVDELDDWAVVGKTTWCGEHQDFEKWLEQRETK